MDRFLVLLRIVQHVFFDLLSPETMARLKRVSRGVRGQVTFYEDVYFAVDKLYGHFFKTAESIEEFRRLQLLTGALVSGSAVVSFLSHARFSPSDLDVFVRQRWALDVGLFLLKLGYTFVPLATVLVGKKRRSEAQPANFMEALTDEFMKARPNTGSVADRYEMTGIAGVFNFCKSGGPKVQVVAVHQEPIAVILGFYSTLVLNIATATEVVSLYPWTSFVENRALYLKRATLAVEAARSKYESRGWTSLTMLTPDQYLSPNSELSTKIRWFGDGHSWIVRFSPMVDLPNASRIYDFLAVTSWHLSCWDPGYITMAVNRLDRDYFARPYFVHSSAEFAVREHPCFESPKSRILFLEDFGSDKEYLTRPDGADLEEQPSAANMHLPVSGQSAFDIEGCSRDTVASVNSEVAVVDQSSVFPVGSPASAVSDVKSEEYSCSRASEVSWDGQDVWRYTRGFGGCSHMVATPPYTPDAIVVDYLKGLYPLLELAHRRGIVLEKLRAAFAASKECCPVGETAVLCPTAFPVSAILRCLTEVASSGCWDEDEVDFEVTFRYEVPHRTVRTICVFRVPVEHLDTARRDTIDWRCWAPEWRESKLEVYVDAVTP
ncbi:hypothetical protein VNI00_005517 [Paramarasmius palmivorus]|uniref:F-box domain-containing protein n=1 Tax=Paramarasmius palmivorus TaxID=297713 RepID=A0AAW0DAJ7_9AGAR